MNKTEYIQARKNLCDAVRSRDFDMANAIRQFILYFYKPDRGNVLDYTNLPSDPADG